ncbi:pyridoxamine 5'-phosphate oxidase family protein [Thermithiobacillus plumbiphilus]|uniref:Pyridoxamine 5'-phosphate oxidase family protein n=1 Tax=Thermithiobacillus plumbiphilus TaxID=1729899 RepID=A0ABU9D7C9_9PROT
MLFHNGVQAAQKRFADVERAHRIAEMMGDVSTLDPEQQAFLESLPFFFLATADGRGNIQCNFKGGGPGVIEVVDSRTICYPEYGGNDLMLSLGNMLIHPYIGVLALSFDPPRRLKLSGRAEIVSPEEYRGRLAVEGVRVFVRIHLTQVIRNCSRRIPRLETVKNN